MGRLFRSSSEDDTIRIAKDLVAKFSSKPVVQLYGELGAGKTIFVRGLVEAMGGDPFDVSSPTFTLIQEYSGRVPIYHVDLYRIASSEVDDLGLEELESGGLVVIEWADKLPRSMLGAVKVYIEDEGGSDRQIRVEFSTHSDS